LTKKALNLKNLRLDLKGLVGRVYVLNLLIMIGIGVQIVKMLERLLMLEELDWMQNMLLLIGTVSIRLKVNGVEMQIE